ncbi:MAG: glycoside hydrolase 43 family protein [Bacteroidales bacterium]|nr:glycoside hydrolase 43 family protein [Bacteroidales bacterium]
MRTYCLILLAFLAASCSQPQPSALPAWQVGWGDQGNGTYINPVLNADFSDPDAIRVGDTYYMVASDFHFLGMQILRSKDLVNWEYITQLYSRFDYPGWETNEHYSGGSWAPSIRYHDGLFYVYFCTPDEGLFMTSAPAPEGPWAPLHCVKEVWHWEDPCPFWDEDGQAYLGHSVWGAGPIILHKMSPDGKQLLDDGEVVYRGPVAEGTKIHKWNGYYYMSIPEGGVGGGVQVILRSASLYGPYEKRVVLEQGSTEINGPHQGAIIDTPEGEWWFLHFQDTPVLGRVVHLQPMWWQDGWPVMGVDIDRNGIGEPVYSWKKPAGPETVPSRPATSDDFSAPVPGAQWQFNHNPVPEGWSLTENPGKLTYHALKAASFREARNTLSQKLFGYEGTVTVKLDTRRFTEGCRAGLSVMGSVMSALGVKMEGGQRCLYLAADDGTESAVQALKGPSACLRFTYDAVAESFQFYYSTDGKAFQPIGEPFGCYRANWKGVRPALFCYNENEESGEAVFDDYLVQ